MYHCCLDVDGGLRMNDAQLSGLFQEVNTGRRLSAVEARAHLVCAKAAGYAVVRVGACDNFDPHNGCQGHEPA